ncbi:MAG: hypothetical protein ACOCG5_10900, partial [Candidatus Alkaliphilus sp. MAG34]
FAGAPLGHHPCDFNPKATNVIVIGIPIPKGVMSYPEMMKGSELIPESIRLDVLQGYYYRTAGFDIINRALEETCLRITLTLEENGFESLYFAPTFGDQYSSYYDKIRVGLFSLRHAAVRAGLGEFGLNNLVINPQYGPRVRYAAIITEADFPASPIIKEKACLGFSCAVCIEECGAHAILLNNKGKEKKKENIWLDPISRTDASLCLSKQNETHCFGRCLAVCPVGRNSQRLLQKSKIGNT